MLAKDMGKALLSQFPETRFSEASIPFIRNIQDAQAALEKIIMQSGGTMPIIFSTLFREELNNVFKRPDLHCIPVCEEYLLQLENIFGARARRQHGTSRLQDDRTLASRVSAIHFTISHDDGTGTNDYDEAELIIVGVSRSGKTPVSVFIATQFGIKTANHPLIENDLMSCHLPQAVGRNLDRVIGLSINPETLQKFRNNRFPASRYALPETCVKEEKQAEDIYRKYGLPVVASGGSSIEETAMQVLQALKTVNFPGDTQ